jgi:tetratricopeptide (TPR) repeat protein
MRTLSVVAALLLVAAVAHAENAPDPRIAQADALLGDVGSYARAIALYREVLGDAPEQAAVRHKLARVLSWDRHFDASIEAYDWLVLEGSVASARVERAEVLSWAGRYSEAEAAFRSLLEEDPRNARAARGLARVLSWSGRRNQAAHAYDDALEIEEDDAARQEWQRLVEGYRPTLSSKASYLVDSDEFERSEVRMEHRTHFDYETQLIGSLGFIDVKTRQELPPKTPGGAPRSVPDDRGYEMSLGVRRSVTEELHAELHAGVRGYEHYGVYPLIDAELSYSLGEGSVMFGVDHRDALDRTASARAADKGIQETGFRLSTWRPVGEHIEFWGQVQGAALSDSNGRHGVASSLAWRPWTDRQLRLTASTGYLGYAKRSPHYYDPKVDVTTRLGIAHRTGLPFGLSIDLEVGAGFGYSREETGGPQIGPAYDLRGAISWLLEPFRISARVGRTQSQRGNSYETTTAGLEISVDL